MKLRWNRKWRTVASVFPMAFIFSPISIAKNLPCCRITSIEKSVSEATARENLTGRTFTFKVKDPRLLKSLRVGEGIYANFGTKQVSLDGKAACCTIVSVSPPTGANPSSTQSLVGSRKMLNKKIPPPWSSALSGAFANLTNASNPNHLPDLVPSILGGEAACSIPAGGSCEQSCPPSTVRVKLGVSNRASYPANGMIYVYLRDQAGNNLRTWTINGLPRNSSAYPGYVQYQISLCTAQPDSALYSPPQIQTRG